MAKKSRVGAGTPATAALAAAGVAHTLHAYAHADGETHFGGEAATALGVDATPGVTLAERGTSRSHPRGHAG
ncbi:hypothetical protein [Mariniluteicoccus flavus]